MVSGVLILSFVGIIIASISADRSINYLWERLRNKTHAAYVELSQNIMNRINDYHEDFDTLPIKLDGNQCKKSKPLNYRHSLRYFMNFFPFFMIAGGLYCILILVEFNNIRVLLEKEPSLIFSTYEIRFCIPKIYFLLIEMTLNQNNYSLYNGFTPVPDIRSSTISLANYIHSKKQIYYSSDAISKMSPSDLENLYQTLSNSSIYMNKGILSAIDLYQSEALYIADSDQALGSEAKASFFALTGKIATSLRALSLSIYQYSSNYVQGALNSFLIYVFAFCIGHLISYFCYYAPHLRKEEKVLKTLKKLMEYIPTVTIKNPKISSLAILSDSKRM